MSKTYLFILGRHPTLSVAELTRTVPALTILAVHDGVCIGTCSELLPGFINTLGGTIKIAEVVGRAGTMPEITFEMLRLHLPPRTGRMIFGISAYGNISTSVRRLLYLQGLELKKLLKEEGRRARYVVSKEKQLSSVVVAKNKLIEEGAEFVVVDSGQRSADGGQIILAKTIAVQPFEEYSTRDFDRPGRSARRGMLPPKLAQMMINIAGGERTLPMLDPFCGSGTVLGEALLLGYMRVIGSDIDTQAVSDSIQYLTWLEERHPEFRGRWQVLHSDVRMLATTLAAHSVGSIITETYLGPPQSGRETMRDLQKIMRENLVPLYRDAFTVISTLLVPGGRASIALPLFGKGTQTIATPLDELTHKLSLEVESLVPPALSLPTTSQSGARYERPDQRVAREIVLLKKN